MKTDREIAWGVVIRGMKSPDFRGAWYICPIAQELCRTGRITSTQHDIIKADIAALRERVFVRARANSALWCGAELKERLRFARLARRGWGDLYEYPLGVRKEMEGWGWVFRKEGEEIGGTA